MDQTANAIFVLPYKKLNIYIKCFLESDMFIRKNCFIVLKVVALGIDPLSVVLSGLTFSFCKFMLYYMSVFYLLVFFLVICNDFIVKF